MDIYFRRAALALLTTLAAAGAPAATFPIEVRTFFTTADGLPSNDVAGLVISNGKIFAKTTAGAAQLKPSPDRRQQAFSMDGLVRGQAEALQVPLAKGAVSSKERWSVADSSAVKFPNAAPLTVTDSRGRVWSARHGAVEMRQGGRVTVYTPAEGLPYDDFTSIASGGGNAVWFGTHKGAIRFDGTTWEYRQGLRWLPGDDVRSVAVEANGNAWFATNAGVGLIERRDITLQEKAKFFEDEIDRRHRRTPYGYVRAVRLKRPGDKSDWVQSDDDNDGLWTAMYGAGECYAYAATHSELAKKRAKDAFEALWFLREVTQGGNHPAPPGFVARSVLPTTGPDPNLRDASPQRDEEMRKRDALWKKLSPRWPVSADGKWYWKADTSSDELDGHFFFYALYYDLVATSDDEKRRVREQVSAIADHLIDHDFELIDWDGKPTRWGVFNPRKLNHDPNWWPERPLNSLSILAYLKVAEHVTGGVKYRDALRKLIERDAFDTNVLIPKTNAGPGSGNQSDDEMAFMDFYNLIRYETDPQLRYKYSVAFYHYWIMERPELNPLFNFMYAAINARKSYSETFGKRDLSPAGEWLEESMDTLRRYPLDRVNWRVTNSQRKDIVLLPPYARERGERPAGSRKNGQVLPIDERFVDHWNHDPWQLDQGGNGMELADGASFLLPYYMGLYHKFLAEEPGG